MSYFCRQFSDDVGDMAKELFEAIAQFSETDVRDCLKSLPSIARAAGPQATTAFVDQLSELFLGDLDVLLSKSSRGWSQRR
jgi:hypothetical protein